MALDISNISTSSKKRLEALDYEKFRSFNSILAKVKGTSLDINYKPGGYLPLNKSEYNGTTNFQKKTNFYIKLNKIIGTSNEIGVLSHDTYDNTELQTRYILIKNFSYSHGLSALYRETSSQLSVEFTKFIENSYSTGLNFAVPGLFHDDERVTSAPFTNWFVQGQLYVNNNPKITTIRGSYSSGRVQFNPSIPYPGSPKSRFEITTGEPDGGEGFTTLIPLIQNSVIKRNLGVYTEFNTTGKTFLFYNRPEDILIYFIQPHGGKTDMQIVLDMIEILEFTDGVILDGSDTTFLFEYAGKGKGRYLNSYIKKTYTKNQPITGLKTACGLK